MVRSGAGTLGQGGKKLKLKLKIPERAKQVKPSWILVGILLAVYALIKLQGWGYARQAVALEKQVDGLRPGLSAIVLSEQLENSRRACEEVASRVRQLDGKNSRLFARLSNLPASITLTGLEMRSRLSLPVQGTFAVSAEGPGIRSLHFLRIRGTFLPGARDPETMIAHWAQSLQLDGGPVAVRRIEPLLQTPGLWEFELEMGDA